MNLSAKNISITINTEMGYIASMLINGTERCADICPLFIVRLCHRDGSYCYLKSTEALNYTVDSDSIIYTGFGDALPDVSIKVTVKAEDGILWWVSVCSVPDEYAVEWVEIPKICLRRLIDNDPLGGKIIFPYDEGILLTDESLLPRYEPEFPMSGAYFIFPNKVCSQFMAYLFENDGLYIGAHDTKRGFKGVDFYRNGNGISLQMRLYTGANFGDDYTSDFPVVWRVCGPHWKSAAEIYRVWLENNLPQNMVPIENNKSLPKWYKEPPIIVTYPVRGIHDFDEMYPNALFPYVNALPHLKRIKDGTGCNVMSLLMHWEGTAPWAPPYMWPPYGGEDAFNEFKNALHKNGDLLGVYCSGFGYTLQSKLIKEYNTSETIKEKGHLKAMCQSPEGKPKLGITCTYQRIGYDICPASDLGRTILEEGYEPIFKSGVDYAQILDQNHGGGQYMCYAREHNHPPMPGEWMTSNLLKTLSDWNKKAPNMLFGCESAASEPFIGNLLMSDNRFELNYPFGTPIPVYAYLYHEYVRNFMGNQCGCPFEPKVDTLRYRLAYSFSIGDIMTLTLAPNGELMTHWGTNDFIHCPDMDKTLLFIKNVMKFYHRVGKKYLYSGKMSSLPDIECEEIFIPLFRGRKVANLPRLLSSVWEEKDGGVAYIVVNPEDEPVTFRIGDETYEAPPLNAILIIK
ncbi:MAG: hypothetical protein IJW19_05690 [Clostridia bacterium]|nr:hypothetical protein [Clostridia bacterium]